MQALGSAAVITTMSLLTACAAPAPSKSEQVFSDPLLTRQGGVLVLVDSCIQRDGLGDRDYFVVKESQAGAHAALEALHDILQRNDVVVRADVILVCGARLNATHSSITVADTVGGERRQASQPLQVSGPGADDPRLLQALSDLSTYAFERAAVQRDKKAAGKKNEPPPAISASTYHEAAALLKEKTQASTVLFLGALGTSISGGKKAAQFMGGMIVGIGTGVATAGLGTGYYAMFIPGHKISGAVMESALIDLESGELTWSNAVRASGDPVQPEVLANAETLDLLLHNIMFQPVSRQ